MKKTILVTGASGYIGGIIMKDFVDKYKVIGLTRQDCDLRDEEGLVDFGKKISPDIIIHAAGNKDIKWCEANSAGAFEANELSVKNLIKTFPGKKIIYISSDYVFSGKIGGYSELDKPNPQTIYGKSKLAGEKFGLENSDNFIVLRASAVFNEQASFPNFLYKELSNDRSVECFSNTFYSPTYYKDFLVVLEKIIENNNKNKIYHSCGERTSRYEFCIAFAKVFGFDLNLAKECQADTNHWFLFPDLSLNNLSTNNIFNINTTKLEVSLNYLKQKYEDYKNL